MIFTRRTSSRAIRALEGPLLLTAATRGESSKRANLAKSEAQSWPGIFTINLRSQANSGPRSGPRSATDLLSNQTII